MSVVVAKMKCKQVSLHEVGANVLLEAVTDDSPENRTWSKYTPSGRLELQITNPAATSHFAQGGVYLVTITKAAEVG